MNKKLTRLIVATGLCVAGSLANAFAVTGYGGQIFATGGNVSVDILPSSSGFADQIEFFYDYTDANHDLTSMTFLGIDNHLATVNLGSFVAGKELVFGIVSPQGKFVSGPGSRNPDHLAHSLVSSTPTITGFAESWLVGFEDLFRGGDKDYNDAIFRVNQQKAASVPEPSSLALVAVGLVGLSFARRKHA